MPLLEGLFISIWEFYLDGNNITSIKSVATLWRRRLSIGILDKKIDSTLVNELECHERWQ